MASYADRESFIPFTRHDTVRLCLDEGQLDNPRAFERFAEILQAYKHFEFHEKLEALKEDFAPFNPDAAHRTVGSHTAAERNVRSERLTKNLREVLESANYEAITPAELDAAFEEESLIKVNTVVDFDDFDQHLLYARGRAPKKARYKAFLRWKEKDVDNFERVVALLKFKEADYFKKRGRKLDSLNFEPGKVYLYLYKNIPRYDLEVLFPNLEARMSMKDKLLFGVPAVAGLGSVLFKSLTQIAIIVGAIFFYLGSRDMAEQRFGVNEDAMVKLWAALSSFLIAFGAVTVRQWNSYRTKKLRFQKQITETLFFKNIASNASVIHALVDEAEEEECKQMVLVYYHLLTAEEPLSIKALDDRIERWFAEKHGVKVDFDIETTAAALQRIRTVPDPDTGENALLSYSDEGHCRALPLADANRLIDTLWDAVFPYAEGEPAKS
ncbi:MAG: TMEM143 family protein [Candidatus Hydrogenedentota bacterium]